MVIAYFDIILLYCIVQSLPSTTLIRKRDGIFSIPGKTRCQILASLELISTQRINCCFPPFPTEWRWWDQRGAADGKNQRRSSRQIFSDKFRQAKLLGSLLIVQVFTSYKRYDICSYLFLLNRLNHYMLQARSQLVSTLKWRSWRTWSGERGCCGSSTPGRPHPARRSPSHCTPRSTRWGLLIKAFPSLFCWT